MAFKFDLDCRPILGKQLSRKKMKASNVTRFITTGIAAALLSLSGCTVTALQTNAASATQVTSASQPASKMADTPEAARKIAALSNYPNFAVYKKSQNAFWLGMTRKEFEARTAKNEDGMPEFKAGKFRFRVAMAKFDDTDQLQLLIAGYVGAKSEQDVVAAYDAYQRSVGNAPRDWEKNSFDASKDAAANVSGFDGTVLMSGWVSPDSTTVLMREYSESMSKSVSKQYGAPVPNGTVMLMVGPM